MACIAGSLVWFLLGYTGDYIPFDSTACIDGLRGHIVQLHAKRNYGPLCPVLLVLSHTICI